MKTTMKKFFLRSLLLSLIVLALGLSFAFAEGENMGADQVELLSEGKFPPKGYGLASRADMAEFNAYILAQLETLAEEIDVSSYGLTLEEFRDAYRSLLNAHPEMFYVSGAYSYYYSGSTVTGVLPQYKYSAEELPAKVETFNRELNKILSYANKASTTVGKLLRANDYICVNYEYDFSYSIYSPEEFFEKGTGVCQAYTLAYAAVLNKLGVSNTTASSDAMNHIWNMVKLDGSWYHVDVTWNDPTADMPYRAKHDNFLRSDTGIGETDHHSWVATVTASSTRYDSYFWQDIDHAVPMLGNLAYFTPNNDSAPDGRICTGNITTGEVKDVLSYDASFFGSYYPNINPLWATSSTIYYGLQDTVYALPMEGGESTPIFSLNDKSEYLFCFYLSGSTLYITSKNMYTGVDTVHSVNLSISAEVTVDIDVCDMEIGNTSTLTYTVEPEVEGASPVWSSSDEAIVTVDSTGLVTAVGPGVATVTLQLGASMDTCTVVVHSDVVIDLPDTLTAIDAEAFTNISATEILLPEGLLTIGEYAFSSCTELLIVYVPESVTSIAASAFDGCEDVTLLCVEGSVGETFAVENGLPCVLY